MEIGKQQEIKELFLSIPMERNCLMPLRSDLPFWPHHLFVWFGGWNLLVSSWARLHTLLCFGLLKHSLTALPKTLKWHLHIPWCHIESSPNCFPGMEDPPQCQPHLPAQLFLRRLVSPEDCRSGLSPFPPRVFSSSHSSIRSARFCLLKDNKCPYIWSLFLSFTLVYVF